jgi:hypothetical protein
MMIGCGAVVGEGVKVRATMLGLEVDIWVGGRIVSVALGNGVSVAVALGLGVTVVVAIVSRGITGSDISIEVGEQLKSPPTIRIKSNAVPDRNRVATF